MNNIYICSPLAGNIEANIANAKRYCAFAIGQGVMPYAPHVYFTQFLDDEVPEERDMGIEAGMKWLALCSEIWVFGNRISLGMGAELEYAKEHGLVIRHFTDDCKEITSENLIGRAKRMTAPDGCVFYLVDASYDCRDGYNRRHVHIAVDSYIDRDGKKRVTTSRPYSAHAWGKIVEAGDVIEIAPDEFVFAIHAHLKTKRSRYDGHNYYKIDVSKRMCKSSLGLSETSFDEHLNAIHEMCAKRRKGRSSRGYRTPVGE